MNSRPQILLFALLTACGGGGAYGFSPEYAPLSAEERAVDGATEVSYEDVRRAPDDYAASKLAWFGVVTSIDEETGLVEMTYRTLAPRNLCADERDSSCRVTVSHREGGPFSARLQLEPADLAGENRIWVGSLLRVVGSPEPELAEDGGPVFVGTYYRHWPRSLYRTTRARGQMRR